MKKEIKKVIDFIQDCGAVKDGGICVESCTNDYLTELLIANNVVKLPAKIGATVWGVLTPCGGCENFRTTPPSANADTSPARGGFDAGECGADISLDTREAFDECAVCKKAYAAKLNFDWEMVPMWGKEVFATQEEAEEAATRKRGANNDGDKKDS